MTDNLLNYIVVGIVGILAVFSFVMGIEKMIKIILGNYILTTICLAAGESISLLANFLNKTPELKFFGISYESFANFFSFGKTTIVLILYAILLVIIYLKGKMHIKLPEDNNAKKWLYIILVPLTIISIILALQIALMGIKVLDASQLHILADNIAGNNYMYRFLSLTPIRILLHGLTTILIASELKINFRGGN